MRRILKTVFPKVSFPKNQQSENKKISYWLEKLFTQEKEKQNNDFAKKHTIISHKTETSAEKKGLEDAIKNHAKKIEIDKQVLDEMVSNSNRILVSISSVFPWDFFPNTLNVEATRVTIIHRQFLASQVHSVDIQDISNVFIDTGFLFATITLVSRTFSQNEIRIIRLRKKEAIFARRIIEGLRMLVRENIQTTDYTVEDLIHKLKELSTTKIVL